LAEIVNKKPVSTAYVSELHVLIPAPEKGSDVLSVRSLGADEER